MPNLVEKKKKGNIDAYESYIPESSLLIGKTVKEVMKGFKNRIIIDHIHYSSDGLERMLLATPKTIFRNGMYIKIFGEWEDICSFTNKFGLP